MKIQSQLLVLAVDYHTMFKALLGKAPNLKPDVDREITWAKQYLKKNNRIVWYLRWIRVRLIADAEKNSVGPDKLPPGSTEKELAAMGGKGGKHYTLGEIINDLWGFKRDLQHYMSIEDNDMQSVRFEYQTPLELMDQLFSIDEMYKEKMLADERLLEPQEGDKAFIKFGNGWAWWALSRGVCTEEAKAMGHCGNRGQVTGDQIISLREPRKKGARDYWEPHLTFIFDKASGLLGEMKGRGNEKPAARYHPYIITLLKDKRIKGIKGGGYLPSHNFSMNDLPEEERAKLEKAKPALMTLRRYLKVKGITNIHVTMQKPDAFIINKTRALLGLGDYNADSKGWVIGTWKDADEFVREKGDIDANWIADHEAGRKHLDMYETGYSNNDMMDLLDDLPKEVVHNIGLTLEYEYPEELLDFITEQGGTEGFTWEPDLGDDVKDFLKYLEEDQGIGTEVMNSLQTSYSYAAEAGMMNQMSKILSEAIKDATDIYDRIKIAYDGNSVWDGKIYAVLTLASAVEAAAVGEEGEEGGDADHADHYGTTFTEMLLEDLEVKVGKDHDYYDWDQSTAIEHMKEKYGKPPKHMKKPVEGQPELFPDVYEPVEETLESESVGDEGG